jgi:hypothetical protein
VSGLPSNPWIRKANQQSGSPIIISHRDAKCAGAPAIVGSIRTILYGAFASFGRASAAVVVAIA